MRDIWLLVLGHLIRTGADVPDGSVFALYHLAQGLGTAPAEEQQCPKEEGTDGGNDYADDCADAWTAGAVRCTCRGRRGRRN
jgi:hypothetical protein